MDINAPIAFGRRPRFAEGSKLAPSRDYRNVNQLWKSGRDSDNAIQETMQGLQKAIQRLSNQKRRIVGGYVPTPPGQTILPFTFYNTTNASNALDGLGNPAQNWLVWQMRDGICGGRSLWSEVCQFQNTYDYNQIDGNYETHCLVVNDGAQQFDQPSPTLYSGFQLIDSTADTLLFGLTTGSVDTEYSCGQIILNNSFTNPDFGGSVFAAFWLQIQDPNNQPSVNGFYVQLWGRMFDQEGGGGRQSNPFPNPDPSIIPICVVQTANSANSAFSNQYQCGNLINRYPGMVGTGGIGTIRGAYVQNQFYYPGDVVTGATFVISGHTFTPKYLCLTYGQSVSAGPTTAQWQAWDS